MSQTQAVKMSVSNLTILIFSFILRTYKLSIEKLVNIHRANKDIEKVRF